MINDHENSFEGRELRHSLTTQRRLRQRVVLYPVLIDWNKTDWWTLPAESMSVEECAPLLSLYCFAGEAFTRPRWKYFSIEVFYKVHEWILLQLGQNLVGSSGLTFIYGLDDDFIVTLRVLLRPVLPFVSGPWLPRSSFDVFCDRSSICNFNETQTDQKFLWHCGREVRPQIQRIATWLPFVSRPPHLTTTTTTMK